MLLIAVMQPSCPTSPPPYQNKKWDIRIMKDEILFQGQNVPWSLENIVAILSLTDCDVIIETFLVLSSKLYIKPFAQCPFCCPFQIVYFKVWKEPSIVIQNKLFMFSVALICRLLAITFSLSQFFFFCTTLLLPPPPFTHFSPSQAGGPGQQSTCKRGWPSFPPLQSSQ